MLNRDQVLSALRDTAGLPETRSKFKGRTIYEGGHGPRLEPSGRFYIDYASYPGGTAEEISLSVIGELERGGAIRRAFPDKSINAWVLCEEGKEK